jgi:hypothetical protein
MEAFATDAWLNTQFDIHEDWKLEQGMRFSKAPMPPARVVMVPGTLKLPFASSCGMTNPFKVNWSVELAERQSSPVPAPLRQPTAHAPFAALTSPVEESFGCVLVRLETCLISDMEVA